MSILETSELSKSYRVRGRLVEAVKGVDIRVEQGEIYGFLGPNGAGKTTTMRMLTTLMRPTGGTATIVGLNLHSESRQIRKHIGYVSQAGGAESDCTARENLVLQGRIYGLKRPEAQRRAGELLSAFELEAIADRKVKTFSGGQRRRLDLALGMVHKPKLLFLDEPTVGLDPQSRNRLWDELRALHAHGTTIFMTTHYLDEADALCMRLAIIDEGKIVASGTPDDLKRQILGDTIVLGMDVHNGSQEQICMLLQQQPFIRQVQVVTTGVRLSVEHGESDLPKILRVIDSAGLDLKTIELARPSLDDVFLMQTGRSLRESLKN